MATAKEDEARVLGALYEAVSGGFNQRVSFASLAMRLGMDEARVRHAGMGLVVNDDAKLLGQSLALTTAGRYGYEDASFTPEQRKERDDRDLRVMKALCESTGKRLNASVDFVAVAATVGVPTEVATALHYAFYDFGWTRPFGTGHNVGITNRCIEAVESGSI